MVTVTSTGNQFIIKIKGLHKIWALKSQISVSKENVIKAYQDKKELNTWSGFRIPGTYIPYLITAGTFYKKGWNFWDVVNKDNIIIVELKDERYKKLYIEVEHPEETIHLLNIK